MGAAITFTRILDAEHVIGESERLMSRETVLLAITTVAINPGTVMGRITATGQWVPHDVALSNGAEVAAGVLFAYAPINTATQKAVMHVRDCLLNGKKMTWKAGISAPDKTASIAALLGANTAVPGGNVQVRF